MRHFLILTILTFLFQRSFSQSNREIDSLLLGLCNTANAKDLSKRLEAKILMGYGGKVLPLLAAWFMDTTQSKLKYVCQNSYLTKGEVAIIMADRIELMSYAKLAGIQNCLQEFCKDNPNLIENYLYAIRRDRVFSLQRKYNEWLQSGDRRKLKAYLVIKEKMKT